MQSVPITTKIVSLNPEVYSIQLYTIKFVSDLRQVGGFPPVHWLLPPIKNDITEILLQVALYSITYNNDLKIWIQMRQVMLNSTYK